MPTVDVRNGRLHYIEKGAGPALVLLHGTGANAALWAEVVDRLSDRFRVLSFDLRCHGQSVCSGAISIEAIANDIAEATQKLGLPSFHLAGVSIGGAAALHLAASTRQRVQSLVLSSVGITSGNPSSNPLADEVYAIREARVYLQPKRFALQFAENLLIPDAPTARVEAFAAAIATLTTQRYFEAFQAFAAAENAVAAANVKVRTLVLRGACDELVPCEAADALSRAIRGSLRRDIPEAGHLPNIDNPAAFATELAGFIGK